MEWYIESKGRLVNERDEEIATGEIDLTVTARGAEVATYSGEFTIVTSTDLSFLGKGRIDLATGKSLRVIVTQRARRVLTFKGVGDMFDMPQD
jgi:hypothetical protein